MIKNIPKRFFIVLISIFILLFLSLTLMYIVFYITYERAYGMRFLDDTKEEKIVINKLFINDKEEPNIRGYTPRKRPPKYDPTQDFLSFKSKKYILNIKAEILYNDQIINAQCTVDTKKQYGVVLASFDGTKNLRCVYDNWPGN